MKTKQSILIQNGIRISPVVGKNKKFAVSIEDDYCLMYKKPTKGKHKHDTKSINKALQDMIDYVYDHLKDKLVNN